MSYQYVQPSPELMLPCGATRYRMRPHGVMKVVMCLSLGSRGMEWYPFHASLVHLHVLAGTPVACLKGVSVKWVWRCVAELTERKSTTRRGSPLFLPTTCILLHHVVGVFDGTLSMTPKAMSCSSSCLTCSVQWAGIDDGLWTAVGVAPSLTRSRNAGNPVIKGRGWWGHVLNAEEAYVSRNHS